MKIIFTSFGSNTAFGGFGPGDRANVSDALAKHLVEEVGVAKYAEGQASNKANATGEGGGSVPPDGAKPSDGLTVAQLKAALTDKNIEIPAGVTRKEDLAALLDGSEG